MTSNSNGMWKELTKYEYNPNWKNGMPWNQRGRYIPTGEKQCTSCYFTTDVNDTLGTHVCPQLKDGYGTLFTIGDKVIVFASGRIRRGEVTKWNQKTEKLSVQEVTDDAVNNHVINTLGKVLKEES